MECTGEDGSGKEKEGMERKEKKKQFGYLVQLSLQIGVYCAISLKIGAFCEL